MTEKEVFSRLTKVVDQFYKQSTDQWIKESQLHYIGGICQSALYLLNLDNYLKFKKYIYDAYGYDPGGCTDGQLRFEECIKEFEK